MTLYGILCTTLPSRPEFMAAALRTPLISDLLLACGGIRRGRTLTPDEFWMFSSFYIPIQNTFTVEGRYANVMQALQGGYLEELFYVLSQQFRSRKVLDGLILSLTTHLPQRAPS